MSDRDLLDREQKDAERLLDALRAPWEAAPRLLRERQEEWRRAHAEAQALLGGEARELLGRAAIERSLRG